MWKYHIIEVSCADYATHNYNYTFVCDWIVMQYKRAAFLLVDKISRFTSDGAQWNVHAAATTLASCT